MARNTPRIICLCCAAALLLTTPAWAQIPTAERCENHRIATEIVQREIGALQKRLSYTEADEQRARDDLELFNAAMGGDLTLAFTLENPRIRGLLATIGNPEAFADRYGASNEKGFPRDIFTPDGGLANTIYILGYIVWTRPLIGSRLDEIRRSLNERRQNEGAVAALKRELDYHRYWLGTLHCGESAPAASGGEFPALAGTWGTPYNGGECILALSASGSGTQTCNGTGGQTESDGSIGNCSNEDGRVRCDWTSAYSDADKSITRGGIVRFSLSGSTLSSEWSIAPESIVQHWKQNCPSNDCDSGAKRGGNTTYTRK